MPIPPELPDLVSAAEVAAIFEVDRATVTRWAQSGRLPVAVKAPGLRGANLFRRADVEALRASAAA